MLLVFSHEKNKGFFEQLKLKKITQKSETIFCKMRYSEA
jgi:hypothetical protein